MKSTFASELLISTWFLEKYKSEFGNLEPTQSPRQKTLILEDGLFSVVRICM